MKNNNLVSEAVIMLIKHKYHEVSASLIQRRLGVCYETGRRLLVKMEKLGLVSKQQGHQPRQVNQKEINNYFKSC